MREAGNSPCAPGLAMHEPQCRTDVSVTKCCKPSGNTLRLLPDPRPDSLNEDEIGQSGDDRLATYTPGCDFGPEQLQRAIQPLDWPAMAASDVQYVRQHTQQRVPYAAHQFE